MAHSPSAYDRGTRFTNYSSIHSADAFVGDYQVMYTPGASPPPQPRPSKKSTRFSKPTGSVRAHTATQSYILPANIPNTSQIMPDQGVLPIVNLRHPVPADEKQIVASLRALQNDLNEAMRTINILTRERDEAMHELRLIKATSRKISSPKKDRQIPRVEEELFDLTRLGLSPKNTPTRQASSKKVSIAQTRAQNPVSHNVRDFAQLPTTVNKPSYESILTRAQVAHQQYERPIIDDVEQSMLADDQTAASNTSRRRRHQALDENMTSAYILPDITVAQPQISKPSVSERAQEVLHGHDPKHINNCEVCKRLVGTKKPVPDFTAQVTELINLTMNDEPTTRPKISPVQALENVRVHTRNQFEHAKQKHNEAWEKYDSIPAPLTSKRHDRVSRELLYWQKKMEEFRLALDNLRDVEEGIDSVEVN